MKNNKAFSNPYICIALVFISIVTVWSQPQSSYVKDAVMPAPNATAMGKFVDVPVSTSTGIPQINIPIYTLIHGTLSLPISLNYHAGGVKISEPASWVGLNWALNAGGMVTRSIAGKADDLSGGYWANGPNLPTQLTGQCQTAYCGQPYDFEPDLFTASYPGGSFKFFFDHNRKINKINRDVDDSIRVFMNGNDFIGFEIMNTQGTKFLFGQQTIGDPNNSEYTNVNLAQQYKSSWYLSKISSHDNAYSITFNYASETYTMKSRATRSYVWTNASQGSQGGGSGFDIVYHPYWNNDINGKRLLSITTGLETVDFHANTLRQDLDGSAYRLDSISIYPTNASTSYCKRFAFTYNYFVDNNYAYSYAKRLQLKTVLEKSCNQSYQTKPHVFDYLGTIVSGNIFLPHRLTNQIDHWDFYNGKSANDPLEVNVPQKTINYSTGNITYGSANRNPDSVYAKHGTLNKITYPTGGFTEYTYESNLGTGQVNSGNVYVVNGMTNCVSPGQSCCGTMTTNSSSVTFNSTQISTGLFDLSAVRAFGGTCQNLNASVVASVWNGGTQVGVSYSFNLGTSIPSGSVVALPLSTFGSLSAGVAYTFRIVTTNAKGTLSVYYPNNSLQNIVGPGIRVKSIRQHDNISTSNDIYTNYEYTESGSSLSSANFANLSPKYIEGYGNVIPSSCTPTDILKWNASSITPLADFNSNILVYNRVKEIKPTNGYSIYTFDVSVATPVSQSFPACTGDPVLTLICHSCPGPELQYRASRGKLLSQYDYNEGGTALRSIVNSYTETSFQSSSPMFRNVYLDCQSCLEAQTPVTKISMYRIPFIIHIGAKSLLNTKIETLDGISTTTTYEYDSQNRHSQPTASYFTNSNNEVNRTETKYTYDLTSSTTKDALLSRNMLIPYETIKKVGGVQIDGNRTNYSLFSTHPRPSTVERFESNAAGTGAWVTKGTYNTYDASGNITQFTVANWPAENYTWQNGLIKTRNYQNFTWTYNYIGNNTRLLQSIVDIDAQTTSFTYDALMRLATSSARGGQVVTTNTYNYYTSAGTYNSLWSTTTYPSVANSYFTSKTDVQYLDGLGRLVETVKKHSAGNDVAHAIVYDNTGRVVKEHIPYPSGTNTGAFVAVPAGHPHKLTAYEASPLNRPSTVTPPSWLATTYTFGTNSAEVSGYTSGTLFRETMTDAQNNVTSTYKDKKGRLIMSRKLNGLDAKTYYTYDTKDRLTQVVPPDATAANTGLIFTYTYDNADRMLSKKVPDAAIVNMVYNSRDQLAYMQDGNLLAQTKYLAKVYDVYGRDSLTGFSTSNGAPNAPTLSEVLTQNYYDGFDGTSQVINLGTSPIYRGKLYRSRTKILGSTSDFLAKTFTYDAYGRATNISGNNHLALANNSAESLAMGYDFADNLLTENRTHTNGVTTQNYNQRKVYDELSRLHDYNVSIAGVENLTARYEYNYRNELIERNQHWGGSDWLQSLDYAYNDQSWLTSINNSSLGNTGTILAFPTCTTSVVSPPLPALGAATDTKDLFFMQLQYNSLYSGLSGTSRGDGNIAQQIWRVRGRERQAYSYAYDGLQRITSASYSDINEAGTNSATARYNTSYTYADLRGNFSNVQRNGLFLSGACYTQALLDNMTYSYTAGTNKISSISDAASAAQGGFRAVSGAMTYDANGNMISNAGKGITSITYNHLNLPINITITGSKTIDFTYDAAGNKLRKVVKTGATINLVQEYSNGIEYRGTAIPATTIEAIYHAEGRLYNNAGWKREYTIKDHLGNTRLAYCDLNNDGVVATPSEILQENNYDAFGYELSGVYMNHSNADNLYQYNGKEKNDDHGISMYDYGIRWYDAGIARFIGVDPIASKYSHVTPFNYAENEPVANIDLWGLQQFKASDGSVINGPFRNQGEANKEAVRRSIQGVLGLGAYTGIQSANVRTSYNNLVSKLDAGNSQGRTQAKIDAREKTPAITKAIADAMRPMSEEGSRSLGTANRTNAGVNEAVSKLGTAGKVAGVAGIAISAYNIATAENKGQAVSKEGGSILGGVVFGELGAQGGAALGFTVAGPPGAVAGAILFGIGGSILGSNAGSEVGKKIYDSTTKPKEDKK